MFSKRLRALKSGLGFAKLLKRLRKKRRESRDKYRDIRGPRRGLTPAQRKAVLEKTGSHCHICGGRIRRNEPWAADHIVAFAHGGKHDVKNFLPAHTECNGYRRHLTAEEFAWVLKLGIWLRGEIERRDDTALDLAERFARHHTRLRGRVLARL